MFDSGITGGSFRRSALSPWLEFLESRTLLSTTYYVDAAAAGLTHDGSSWGSAFTDLQQALSAAASGDSIHIAGGTYKPTSTTDRTISFQLKSGVSIYGGYAGSANSNPDTRDVTAYPTILSGDIGTIGNNTDNSYHVVVGSNTDSTAILDGVTISNGLASGTAFTSTSEGGGIYNYSGSPSINNCIITANRAVIGGGMYNDSHSSPTVSNCTFSANVTTSSGVGGGGGGVGNGAYSSPTLNNCAFTGNSAGSGGGISSTSTSSPILSGCTFTNNQGGSAYFYGTSSPSLTNCTFTADTATALTLSSVASTTLAGCTFTRNTGGAIDDSSSTLTLTNCVFNGNSATSGGGIINYGSTLTARDCTFTGNTATAYGGAFYSGSSSSVSKLINCTFYGNSAGTSGSAISGTFGGQENLNNCILWANSEPDGDQSDATSTATYTDYEGGYQGTGNANVNPLFVRNPSPGADGKWGTTDDDYGNLQLPAYSPLVDAGSNALVPADVTTDLAGNNRFTDVPTTTDTGSGTAPIVDMGAFEAQPALSVTADGPYYAAQGGSITLHVAGASNISGPLTYQWDFNNDGVFNDATGANPTFNNTATLGTITVTVQMTDASLQTITSSATITVVPPVVYVDASSPGPTHDGTSWSSAFLTLQQALAAAMPNQRINVAQGTYKPTSTTDRTASFQMRDGISIFGGYAGSTKANPNLRDIVANATILSADIGIVGNKTDNTYHVINASYTDATVAIDGFTISGANANGTGLYQADGGGILDVYGNPTVSNCTFSNNTATSGGGMYNKYASATVTNCTFTTNSATSEGGAVRNSSGSTTLANCVFTGNVSTSNGGGIYNSGGVDNILGCVFSGNSSGNGGAVDNNPSTVVVANCTFSSNSATNGGAVYNATTGAYNNCVFWNNSATTSGPQIYYSFSTPTITYSDVQGGFTGTGNINSDPTFMRTPSIGADGKWGTADDDYGDLRLLPGSPCIDVGSNSAVPASLTTDVIGNPRLFDFPGAHDPGAIVDLGAYEANTSLGSLHLTATQAVSLPQGRNTFSTTQLAIDSGGKLNLADDSLIVDYTQTSPIGTWSGTSYNGLLGLIASGRNGGAWNGNGINSSVANQMSGKTALGIAEASNVLGITGSQTATWNGKAVDATSVLIGYAYVGDANLDGTVNALDFNALATHFGQTGGGWQSGDFNYDGTVSSSDFALLAAQYGQKLAQPAPVAAQVSVLLSNGPIQNSSLFSTSAIEYSAWDDLPPIA